MKAVLKSIQPKQCELIASGKCTVLVCKTAPKLATPFKCYIYMTKSGNPALEIHNKDGNSYAVEKNYRMAGNVIGEFVCDKIGQIRFDDDGDLLYEPNLAGSSPCLSLGELQSYIGVNNVGYGWHISELKIYDKPKELFDYYKPLKECDKCKYLEVDDDGEGFCNKYNQYLAYYDGYINWERCYEITRPPQSWCYIEVN